MFTAGLQIAGAGGVGGAAPSGAAGIVQLSDGASALTSFPDLFARDQSGGAQLGVGTITPGAFGSFSVGNNPNVHVKSTSTGYMIIEGGGGAVILLHDSGGAVDDKTFQWLMDAGVFKFRSFNDNATVRQDNILVMDMGTGFVGVNEPAPAAPLHVKASIGGFAAIIEHTLQTVAFEARNASASGIPQFITRSTDLTADSTAGFAINFTDSTDTSRLGAIIRANKDELFTGVTTTHNSSLEFSLNVAGVTTEFLRMRGAEGALALGSGEGGVTAATGNIFRAPDVATGGAGNVVGADSTWAGGGLGTGIGAVGSAIIEAPQFAASGDFLQTRVEAARFKTRSTTSLGVGIGTSTPGDNVYGGTTDFGAGGTVLHMQNTVQGVATLFEGSGFASTILADLSGAANDKAINWTVSGGISKFLSLNDNNTTRVDNILVMDLGTGFVGMGTTTQSAENEKLRVQGGIYLQGNVQISHNLATSQHYQIYTPNSVGGNSSQVTLYGGRPQGTPTRLHLQDANSSSASFTLTGGLQTTDSSVPTSTVSGRGAFASAVTNRSGGGLDIIGGRASTTAGVGDGGPLNLNGGAGAPSGNRGTVNIGNLSSSFIGLYGVTAVIQASKINDPSGGATVDSEARTAINAILDALEGIGVSAAA